MLSTPDSVYSPYTDTEFMSKNMKNYFKRLLVDWRDELSKEYKMDVLTINDVVCETDPFDRAALEIDLRTNIRTMDRDRKLINKIDEALLRIENGTYGYCENTGEKIEIARLIARPVATLCIEEQRELERIESLHRKNA